jgi:hypothetical protein
MPTHRNDQDRSWRRKVARAEEHLLDFANRIAPLQERRAYPVSEGFEDYEGSRQYVRRVSLPHLDDPMLEILVGELMFNARSALDHLACALVPPGERTPKVMRATQFPIFTVDIDDPANANARDGWRRQTQGFPAAAADAVKKFQPFAHPHPSLGAEHHSLALLGDLQNADKHRQLLIVVESLHDPIIRHIDATGGVTYESDAGEGGRGPFRGCPDVFALILRNVAGICDELEPLITTRVPGVGLSLAGQARRSESRWRPARARGRQTTRECRAHERDDCDRPISVRVRRRLAPARIDCQSGSEMRSSSLASRQRGISKHRRWPTQPTRPAGVTSG